jgi:hypothetical protein
MEARSQTLQGRVTPKEKAMVEKHCKVRGEPVSDYVRSAVLASMVFDGSGDALYVLADAAKRALKRRMEEWIETVPKVA